ncbi:unnamed protein product [Camellia sinensis]
MVLGQLVFFSPEIYSSEFTTPLAAVIDKCIQSAPIRTRRALYKLKDLQVFTVVCVIFQLAEDIPCISAGVVALLAYLATWDDSSGGDLLRRCGSPVWGRGVIPSALVIFQGRLLGKFTCPTPAIMTDVGQSKLGKASGATLKPRLPLECNGDSNPEYGDIKPDNLLVTAAGTVKIGDFSVSQVFK